MLARHMFGYAPSLVVTGIVSLASLSFFTHLLSHAEYGQYALAINMMTMLLGVCFLWLQNAASRLMPIAVIEGNEAKLTATLYGTFGLTSLVVLVFFGLTVLLMPLGDWRVAVIFAPLVAILRALLNVNQAFHRNFIRITRYNIIEAGQAIIGLAAAIFLITFIRHGASEVMTGLVIGLAVMAALDWRMIFMSGWWNFDRKSFKEILHFGLPFIANFAFSFILSGSDRFLIEFFLGPDQVGLYYAGYAFPDRIGQYLFMAVATASFPLVVRRLEQEGIEAARNQTYTNGVAILAIAMPACIGMLMANQQIASVLIGADFRASAVNIMPWIAVSTMCNGFAAHYFDHAFLLARKTQLFFLTLGPAALLNVGLNLYAIPHYGIVGAAYTTLAAYGLYLVLSILWGRRVFRIKFPYKPMLHIALSSAIMAFILSSFHFSQTLGGLTAMVVCGAAVYILGILTFDVMGTRTFIEEKWQLRTHKSKEEKADLHFEILKREEQIEEIATQWKRLHEQTGGGLFGSYSWFQIWWSHLGKSGKNTLSVITGRTASGQLVALLPLVVRRRGFLRILEWGGHEVFDYGDVLALDKGAAEAIWRFVDAQKLYDIALIKDVHPQALSLPVLTSLMPLQAEHSNYFLTLDFPSGEAWVAAQSRKLRGDIRRKSEKMSLLGKVAFHIYDNDTLFPDPVIDMLCAQKWAQFGKRWSQSVFARSMTKAFLHKIALEAARQKNLCLAWLSCGDKIVACHMGFIYGGILYLYHTTYDATYGSYSPGNILMMETIKAAIDAKIVELDFMRGDEVYKQRFASGARSLSTFIVGHSWIGRFFVFWHGALRRKNERARGDTEN